MHKQYAHMSAAIRDGAKIRPQAFGHFHYMGKSCAYGAALEATRHMQGTPEEIFPYLITSVGCPAGCEGGYAMGGMVIHLNDLHHWTREATADWLYTEEERLGFITLIENEDDQVERSELSPQRSAMRSS